MPDTLHQYDDIKVDKATESNLRLLNTAQDFATYTEIVTKNKNAFPATTRNTTVRYLRDTANEICRCLSDANSISDKTLTPITDRLKLQEQAIRACNYMLLLIERANINGYIDIRRRQYWGSKAITLRRSIMSWHNSDRQRYKV